jgi:hypothetical protein
MIGDHDALPGREVLHAAHGERHAGEPQKSASYGASRRPTPVHPGQKQCGDEHGESENEEGERRVEGVRDPSGRPRERSQM